MNPFNAWRGMTYGPFILAIMFAFAIGCNPAFALTKYWDSTCPAGASTTCHQVTNATNWNGDIAPTTNDDVVFNSSSVINATWNTALKLASFNITSAYTGQVAFTSAINVTGNVNILGVPAINALGSITGAAVWITTNGNWTDATQTLANGAVNIIMNGTNQTITHSGGGFKYINQLNCSSNTTVTSDGTTYYGNSFYVMPSVYATIPSGKTVILRTYLAGAVFNNLGTMEGAGTLTIWTGNTAFNVALGTITSPIIFSSVAVGNSTVTLTSSAILGSSLTMTGSASPNYTTITGNQQLNVTGLVNMTARANMTQGNAQWNFNGGLEMCRGQADATGCIFNQGGENMTVVNSTVRYNGTITGNATQYWLQYGNWTMFGGTTTASTVNLIFNGTNRWLTMMTSPFKYIQVNSSGSIMANSSIITDSLLLLGNLTINNSAYSLNNSAITMQGGFLHLVNGSLVNNTINSTVFWLNGTNTSLNLLSSNPTDKNGIHNITKYLNITNITPTGSYNLNITYADGDLNGRTESNLKLYSYDTSWHALTSSDDATNNMAYGTGMTAWGIVSPELESYLYWSANISQYPANYSLTNTSEFNITINANESISKLLYESNYSGVATNYTMTNTYGGAIYNYSLVLPAGTFYWKSYANDSFNDQNGTDTWTFTINRSDNLLTMLILPATTVTYPTTTTSGCSADFGTPSFYRNGTAVTNPEGIQLGADFYNYTCDVAESQNYSANSSWENLTVSQNTSAQNFMNLTLNGTESNLTAIYPNSVVNVTSWNTVPEIAFVLFMNDTVISDSETTYNAGNYIFIYNTSGNANYSSANKNFNLSISKGYNPVYLTMMDVVHIPISSATYPDITVARASSWCVGKGCGSLTTMNLYRNGTYVDHLQEIIRLPADVWEYKVNATGSANYLDNDTGVTVDFNVSKGTPTNLMTFIDDLPENTATSYPYNITAKGNSTTTTTPPTFNLYLNLTTASGNPAAFNTAEAIGTYNIIYNTSGNANWSSASNSTLNLTIYNMLNATFFGRNVEVNPVADVGINGTYWSIGRYYNITDLGGGWYDINVSYNHADLAGNPFPEANLRFYNWNGTDWIGRFGALNMTNNHIYVNGATTFGEIAPMTSASLTPANAPYVCVAIDRKMDVCTDGNSVFIFRKR